LKNACTKEEYQLADIYAMYFKEKRNTGRLGLRARSIKINEDVASFG